MKIYQTMGLGLALLLSLSVTGCGVKQVAMSGWRACGSSGGSDGGGS